MRQSAWKGGLRDAPKKGRWSVLRISHDKVSGALYIKLLGGRYDHTDFSEKADVYLDVDADGDVLGLEALSFEDLAEAIEERGGNLELPERLAGSREEESGGRSGSVIRRRPAAG
jgi:uncharacterized protein YuzE